jgi:ribosomal protein S27AE
MAQPVIYAAMIGGTVRLWVVCDVCGGQIFLVSNLGDLIRLPCSRCHATEIPDHTALLAATA